MKDTIAIIMAAGKGTRMKSKSSKLLHKIYGKEIITRAVENVKKSGIEDIITVVGYKREEIQNLLKDTVKYAIQEEQLGTGHAVMQAAKMLEGKKGKVLVLNGDHPIMRPETLRNLVEISYEREESATILTMVHRDVIPYGKVIHDEEGRVKEIIEHKDCNEEQIQIREVNLGMYCFDIDKLLEVLKLLKNDNVQKEYYLTDVIKLMYNKGLKTGSVVVSDNAEVLGINDRLDLQVLTKALQLRINTEHMRNGVTIEDINTTYIYDDVEIGMDTIIHPNTIIKSGVKIGEDCEIGPNAYIREDCKLDNNVKIGSFVELKKVEVGKGTKIPHLSYIGDCKIGQNTNIGCGTITCNYDGTNKNETIIGNNCFIGSNSNLIAPIKLGNKSFIAAGSTITDDVPAESLAIARQKQINKEGWNN
ncbi:MAG: NTP transferase domain-containing protein [Clostridia bacterium]|nr:NTP transferase domain-containing protein [Clostridia bacterium]